MEDRRGCERDLVAAYHRALVDHGVTSYALEQCWDDYRFAMVQGPLVAVFGFAYGTRTERGDQMFAAMVRRACAAIRDLDTLASGASAPTVGQRPLLAGGDLLVQVDAVAAEVDLDGVPRGGVVLLEVGLPRRRA